jgi:hypothetical protein
MNNAQNKIIVYDNGDYVPYNPDVHSDINPNRLVVEVKDFPSLDEIATANRVRGWHWFDKDTIEFFGTVFGAYVGYGIFITSEKPRWAKDSSRRYSVRIAENNGQVHTFGGFQGYSTRATAKRHALKIAKLLKEGFTVVDTENRHYVYAQAGQ